MLAGEGIPVLDAEGGDALDVLDALLGRRRPTFADHVPLEAPSPKLLTIAADRIARRCLATLASGGGWRARTFLRDGERATGRLFDAALNDGFALRLGDATRDLFVVAARSLPSLSSAARRSLVRGGDQRAGKRLARELVAAEGTEPGDWIFYALVHDNVARFGLGPDAHDAVTHRLRRGSPLAALLRLDCGDRRDDAARALAPLLEPRARRIPECLEERMAAEWRLRLTEALRPAADPGAFAARWATLAAALGGWLDALREARRLDLVRPLARTLAWLLTEGLPRDVDLRQEMRRRSGASRIQEGDAALLSMGLVAALVEELGDLRAELAEQRYGERRWAESQLFLREHDDALDELAAQAREVTRALRGAIG